MTKAIIFDCFGVLTNEGFGAFRAAYFIADEEKKIKANQAMNALNKGSLEYDKFLIILSKISNEPVEEVERQLSINHPNVELFAHIRDKLKPDYKIGMLSNAGDNWLEEMFTKNDIELFDDIVLSYAHGVIKPSKEIFKLSAKRLGVKLDECVLIDDNQKHVSGALSYGMKAILYQDFEQMKQELEQIISQKV